MVQLAQETIFDVDMLAENLSENLQLTVRNLSLQANSRSHSCSHSEKPGEPRESCSCAGYARMCKFSPMCEFSRAQTCADCGAQWLVGCTGKAQS
jgi:hypothetical protein